MREKSLIDPHSTFLCCHLRLLQCSPVQLFCLPSLFHLFCLRPLLHHLSGKKRKHLTSLSPFIFMSAASSPRFVSSSSLLRCPSPHYSSSFASSDICIFCSPSPLTSSPHFFIACHPTSLPVYPPLHFSCLLALFDSSLLNYDHASSPSSPCLPFALLEPQ